MYFKSDKYVSSNVVVSPSAMKRKHIINLVIHAESVLKRHLSYDSGVVIRITPIRSRNVNGRYWERSKLVELDSRLGSMQTLEVLAHELVHAEQYHTGKLKSSDLGLKIWDNTTYANRTNYRSVKGYKKYRDLPWEVEAWDRQSVLANQVLTDLNIFLDN